MKIFNKQTMFSIENENEKYKLLGTVSITEDGVIKSLSGIVIGEKDVLLNASIGDFDYSETDTDTVSLNLYNMSLDKLPEIYKLVEDTIAEIRKEMTEEVEE